MLKKKASANSKQNYNRGYVREVRRWSAKPFTRVQIPLPSPTIGVKMENNIDINQYIQFDEKVCDMIIYINKNKFLADALEYLQNDNQDYQIIVEE